MQKGGAGMPGVSHHDRPCDRLCRQCGRTDLVLDTPIQKMTRELAEGKITFLQYAITCGTCPDCKVVTYYRYHTWDSFGKKLMAILTSYNNESVSVKGMVRLIRDVFGAHISAGAVSCKSQSQIHSKTVILDDTRLFYSPLCPPPERAYTTMMPRLYGTARSGHRL